MIFYKYVGSGNDFILLDCRGNTLSFTTEEIVNLCDRQRGIGADGLLVWTDCLSPYEMHVYNKDGSFAGMCGNGLRCFAAWIGRKENKDVLEVSVSGRKYYCKVDNGSVSVTFLPPKEMIGSCLVKSSEEKYSVETIDTGVPHAVLFLESIDDVDLKAIATSIREQLAEQIDGINVNIAKRLSPSAFKLRTDERGVGETLGCGTGAVAVALTAAKKYNQKGPISLLTKSGETLNVEFSFENGSFKEIIQTGKARFVFSGEVHFKNLLNSLG